MARSVSAEFKNIWKRKLGTIDKVRIRYKRRYWNGSAYVNEANWQTLSQDKFVGIGDIPMVLDSQFQSRFLATIVSVKLENTNNQWLETTVPPSIFAIDSTATTGYKLFKTIVEVSVGYVLSSGSTEWVAVFTGFALRVRPSGSSGLAELMVTSRDILLEKADAENVSDTFTLENCIPATGDGSNKAFESTSTGVDHATDLQVNAVSITEGTGYKTSNDNQVVAAGNTGRLAITANTAPSAGQTVKVSGKKWKANNAIDTLIGLLCTEAGITGADRTINTVVFPGGVSSSQTIDTKAQWDAGSVFTNIDTTALSGSIIRKWFLIDDFTDGNYTSSPVWTEALNGGSASAATNALVITATAGGASTLYTPLQKTQGTWRFRAKVTGPASAISFISIMTHESVSLGFPSSDGYALRLHPTDDDASVGEVTSGLPSTFTGRVTKAAAGVTAYHSYRITRTAAGVIEFFYDEVSQGTFTDTAYSPAFLMLTAGIGGVLTVDDIYFSDAIDGTGAVSSATAVYEYRDIDLLAAPISWGTMDITKVLNGGTITVETDANAAAGGPYGYSALGAGNVIASDLQRYLSIRVTITPATGSYISPELQKLVANYATSNVFIALANFRGMTCMAAVEKLAQIANYEIGFDGDGKFFFRSKTVSGSPTVTMNQENGVIDVLEYDRGTPDRVFNVGRVRSGGFVGTYDKTSAAEAEPTSETQYGRIVKDVDLESFLLSNDGNIRTAMSRSIYEKNFIPPVRLRLKIWYVPWLELSDIVRVSIYDHPLLRQSIAGDPLQLPWGGIMAAGEAQNVLARDLDMKVLEYKPNLETNQAEVLLEAI